MTAFRRTVLLVTVTAVASVPACGVFGDVKDLVKLSFAVATEYGEDTAIKLTNGERLTVTLKNSKYADLPEARRMPYARGVAQFVFAHYPQPYTLATIRVGFLTETLSADSTSVPYSWSASELRAGADSLKRPRPSGGTDAIAQRPH
jgi:hypothetical protein